MTLEKIYTHEEATQESVKYFKGDELAASVFVGKYALRNAKHELLESNPDQTHRRLAKEFARIEQKYPNPLSEEEIYSYFKNFQYIVPQGSPMSAIGNTHQIQSASNCFVIPSPLDSYGGILLTDQEQAQIMKRRGGVGFDISNIRPKGISTKNAARTTDGIGVFMDRFSNTCREVAQNGRRGALMLTISCHHPEIRTFINIKRDKKKVTGANISIRMTDEFMKAVKSNSKVELRFPVDSKTPTIREDVDARTIWNEIVDAAWESAEPGILFWDSIINNGPADIYEGYKSTSTNPCVVGDTLVYCANGRGNVSIRQLAEEGKDIDVFCYNNDGKIVIRKMRHPRVTGYNEKIYKVTFDDGNSIKCTNNHKIRMIDGTYKQVKDIQIGEQVKILTKFEESINNTISKTNRKSKNYFWLNNGGKTSICEHRIIAEYNYGKEIDFSFVVHHRDFNTKNNSPENLVVMTKEEHDELHRQNMLGDKNPMRRASTEWSEEKWNEYRKVMAKATGGNKNGRYMHNVSNDDIREKAIELTKKLGIRFSEKEWIKYANKNNLPKHFSAFRKYELGSVSDLSLWAAQKCELHNYDVDPRLQKTLKFAIDQGYISKIVGNEVFVEKTCECCSNKFFVSFFRREGAFCSYNCSLNTLNARKDLMTVRINNSQETHKNKAEENKKKQLDLYTEMKFIKKGENILLKDFYINCLERGISCRFKTKNGFKSYTELKEMATIHNHRITSIEYVGNEDVYNGTVDDYHNFFIGGFEGIHTNGKCKSMYINNLNCGEITLSPYDSCRLMVVNLHSFVNDPYTKNAKFDYEKFSQVTQVAQRLMDDMIDIELEQVDKILKKIHEDTEPDNVKKIELDLWNNIKKACINGRRTGLGITSLGDALAALNIQYGSKASITTTEEIYKALAINSEKSSCIMAKERGAFPIFDAKLEKGHPFIERLMDADADLKALYKKYGRRNISTTTTAPTGSISTMTQTTSGIEPSFLLKYTRRKKINPNDKAVKPDFVDDMGDKWQEFTVYHHGFKKWMDVTEKTKIEDSPYYKATSNEIDWVASVNLQAAAQKWISHSISKTCNLPNSASKELVSEIYMKAWESGCKGFTIYRDGCRTGVLIEEQKEVKKSGRDAISITKTTAPKRPASLKCEVHHVKLNKKLDKVRTIEYCAVVGLFEGGEPYELFVFENGTIDKKYTNGKLVKKAKGQYDVEFEDGFAIKNIMKDQTEEEELVTRLVSTSLRHGTPLEFLVHQLEKVRSDNFSSFTKVMCRVLKKYIKDGTKVTGETCPGCGSKELIRKEGCMTCVSCGWSKCG